MVISCGDKSSGSGGGKDTGTATSSVTSTSSGSGTGTSTSTGTVEYTPGPGSYEGVYQDETWYDAIRDRDVPVRIYAPDLSDSSGPFPVVVFSHGGGESRDAFPFLGEYWSACGYAVVFINHVGHDRAAYLEAMRTGDCSEINSPSNHAKRPQDVSFVLDFLLSPGLNSSLLAGRIDTERICAAGQCAGSTTALAIAGLGVDGMPDNSYIDGRVMAAIALSPQPREEHNWERVYFPTLVMTGTDDFNWENAVKIDPTLVTMPYRRMTPGGKYHVSIQDAEHNAFTDSVPYYPCGPRDPRHHGWIQRATTAFLDAYLRGDSRATEWIEDGELETETYGECAQEFKPLEDLYRKGEGPFTVKDVESLTLYDAVRDKNLQVRLYYPEEKGNFPLLLFSHALEGCKDYYVPLIRYWTSHGYVCILPDHVGSANLPSDGNDGMAQWRSRPRDMSFVLDSLSEITDNVPDLDGRLDAKRVGACGVYIGAATSNYLVGTRYFGAGGVEEFVDTRVDASLALSPEGREAGCTNESWIEITRPMLVLTGSNDPSIRTGNPPEWRTEPYLFACSGDKYLVWIEGLNALYGGLGENSGNVTSDMAHFVSSTTLAYLDSYLKYYPLATRYMISDEAATFSNEDITISRK